MTHDRFHALTDEQLDRIDAACSDLEESWKRGESASIEQQLVDADPAMRSVLLRELLAAEIELRRSCGESPQPAEYEVRFPNHVEEILQAFGFAGDGGSTAEMTMTAIFDGKEPAKTHDRVDETVPQQFGRYLLVRLLGRGGMGSVYLAHDQELDRKVAIKFPVFDNRPELNAVERFRREARAMAALHHPNLCPVYDVGQLDGRHYLTMAFVEGHTLSDAQHSQAETVRIVSGVARALQSAHEAGIVHRDLKPANVMINTHGEPIVMDFGLASRNSASEAELTQSGLIVGSPAYMAPEQVDANNELIGPRTDVYALGVILYQLLTGRRPFDGAGLSVLGQISAGRKPLPPSVLAVVDARLEAICLKAMAHHIEDRYQTAAELAVALDDYASKPLELPAPPVRRSNGKLLATAVVIAALILVAMLVPGVRKQLTDRELATVNEAPIAAVPKLEPSKPIETSTESPRTDPSKTEAVLPKSDPLPLKFEASLPQDLVQLGNYVLGPKIAADGLSLWFHAPADNAKGDRRLVLWQAWRHATNTPFAAPLRVDESINNQPDHNLTDVTLSADGLVLSFCRTRTPVGSDSDLWLSTRPSGDASWSAPVSAGAGVNSEFFEWEPELSPNGLELFFHSNRPNGSGGTDLWVSRRANRDAEFGPAENLGPEINSKEHEGGAALSSDGLTLLFHRVAPDGVSLWRATRKSLDASFEVPQPVTISLPANEQFVSVSLSAAGDELYGQRRSTNRTVIAVSRLKPARSDPIHGVDPMNRVTTSKQLPAAAADTDKNFALRLSPGLHVEMPSLKLDPAAPLTIELWVTPQSRVTDNKHVFGWPGPISLFIRQEDSCWAFGLSRTGKFQFAKDPQPITPNRRVHLATVRNGKDFQLFVDGQRVASDREHESPLKYAAKPFSLSVPGSNAFTGEYDELRISRIVRYDDTFEPQHRFEPDSDTLALYHCDENGGEQLLDASAHKHHGQIFGKAKWIAVSKAAATDAEQRK